MSKFFDKSDLIRNDVDKIVSDTLRNCDDGELYFEESKSESILLDDNKIKSSNYSSDLGFGFRAISKDVVAYSHSNEISKDSLKNSSENLKSTLKSVKGTYNHEIPKTNNKFYDDINPIDQKGLKYKLEILNNVNDFLRLPKFKYFVKLYYSDIWFDKKIPIELGTNLYFRSSYFANAFSPDIQQFYIQNHLNLVITYLHSLNQIS